MTTFRAECFRDLGQFFYVNTDRSFRDKYLDICLRTYYTSFSSYLPSNFKMSFDKFEREFQERRAWGLVWGLMVKLFFN